MVKITTPQVPDPIKKIHALGKNVPLHPTSGIPSPLSTIWENLFITICKSKKVKLISIGCGAIPGTDSGLGLIYSPQKCSIKLLKNITYSIYK